MAAIEREEKEAAEKSKRLAALSTQVQMLLLMDIALLDVKDFLHKIAVVIRVPDEQLQLEVSKEAASGAVMPDGDGGSAGGGTLIAFRILPPSDNSDTTGVFSRRAAQSLQRLVKADALQLTLPSGSTNSSEQSGPQVIKVFGVNTIAPPDGRESMVYSPLGASIMKEQQKRRSDEARKQEEEEYVDVTLPPRCGRVRVISRTSHSLSVEWRSPIPHGMWNVEVVLGCSYVLEVAKVPADTVSSAMELSCSNGDSTYSHSARSTLADVDSTAVDGQVIAMLPFQIAHEGLLNWSTVSGLDPGSHYILRVRPRYGKDMGEGAYIETRMLATRPPFDAVDLPSSLATPEPAPSIVDTPKPPSILPDIALPPAPLSNVSKHEVDRQEIKEDTAIMDDAAAKIQAAHRARAERKALNEDSQRNKAAQASMQQAGAQ